jgi:hypothetical protein
MSPLSNRYLKRDNVERMEQFYPLHVRVCDQCFLVQLPVVVTPNDIFSDYAYFSSYSDSWLDHCRRYVESVTRRFCLGPRSQVVELASNDGYLLQYFKQGGVPALGIEPAANVAKVSQAAGIETIVKFFGEETASELRAAGRTADLLLGNNVLAHVPDINDFVKGMQILLKPAGIITMEFPHLLRLMQQNQFDTIYHEHFSYLSLMTVERIFGSQGLRIFDVEQLSTHGGSLRVYAAHVANTEQTESVELRALRGEETKAGLDRMETYGAFAEQVRRTKRRLLEFLVKAKDEGKTVVGYGAPAKGNTLLNYCGIRTDFIDYTVDRNPYKQGRFLPGTHIPVAAPEQIMKTRPDYVLILPWNLEEEIVVQMTQIRAWGGKFVVPIPELRVIP